MFLKADQRTGLLHSLGGRLGPPRIRTDVVAAQQHLVLRQSDLSRKAGQVLRERVRRHPGVSTLLIDLVGGGLDEDAGPVEERLIEGSWWTPLRWQ